MTIHYMDGGPFETSLSTRTKPVRVIAYDSRLDRFIASYIGDGQAFDAPAHYFDPPPPIPAAARQPQVGEVWVTSGMQLPRAVRQRSDRGWELVSPDGKAGWMPLDGLSRPATPAESEPFRPLLDGLKRSLGET